MPRTDEDGRLAPSDGARLLSIARRALETAVAGAGSGPEVATGHPETPTGAPALHAARGAFVTLRSIRGGLRGCVGRLEAALPLWRLVADLAAGAALRDPRFPALAPSELPGHRLEVSVLFALRAVDPGAIVPGRDGIAVRSNGREGVLLPRVALDASLDREAFLAAACRKAGLPPEAWRARAEIRAFEVQVFAEPCGPEEAGTP